MQVYLCSEDLSLLEHWENSLSEHSCISLDVEGLKALNEGILLLEYPHYKHLQGLVHKEKLKVFVLERVPTLTIANRLLKEGVKGYANALVSESLLKMAVETLTQDLVWLQPELISALVMQIEPQQQDSTSTTEEYWALLSPREQESAKLLLEGMTYIEAAQYLGISARTVKAHAQNIYTKLQVKDRLAMAMLLR